MVVTVHARGPHDEEHHVGPAEGVGDGAVVAAVVPAHQEGLLLAWGNVHLQTFAHSIELKQNKAFEISCLLNNLGIKPKTLHTFLLFLSNLQVC